MGIWTEALNPVLSSGWKSRTAVGTSAALGAVGGGMYGHSDGGSGWATAGGAVGGALGGAALGIGGVHGFRKARSWWNGRTPATT